MLDFIVNPVAGGEFGRKMKRAVDTIEKVLVSRGVAYSIHYTGKTHDATAITEEVIKNGATDVIVVGGDGTLHEVINGFSNFDRVNLGLIPAGTGNDFACAIGLPLDVEKAVEVVLTATPKYTDFMQMPTVRGMNVIGIGIDVAVLKRYESLKKKTKFGYTKSLLQTLFKYKPDNFNANIDGIEKDYNSFIVAVCNGNRFGGGIPVCPIAEPSDNKLNFVAVKGMGKLKLVSAFIQLKKGKILSLKETTHTELERIKLTLNPPYTVNVDGELYEDIPFDITVVKNQLKMYR